MCAVALRIAAVILAGTVSAFALLAGACPTDGALTSHAGEREGPPAYRLLILDIQHEWAGGRHDLRLIDVESGKELATRFDLGGHTDLAVSPRADTIAVISQNGLNLFATSDLHGLQAGTLPPLEPGRRVLYQQGASRDARLTPDGKNLLVQTAVPIPGEPDAHQATSVIHTIRLEQVKQGEYGLTAHTVEVPRSWGVQIVQVAHWPRVHLWNATVGLLQVADLATSKITRKLYLGDDPEAAKATPEKLENADKRWLYDRVRFRGVLIAGDRYAYYLPRQPWKNQEPGYLKKIDLACDPPNVIHRADKPELALHPGPAVASEPVGHLFVVQKPFPAGNQRQPARRVRVYATKDLRLQQEFDLPVADCHCLEVSSDGKYLYALDSTAAQVAVLDAATCKQVRMLTNVGKYPHLLLAVPQTARQ
jgi:hypothetical protein